jgi:hypothetical protein
MCSSARAACTARSWFGEELLHGDPATAPNPAWLVSSRAVQIVSVPSGEAGRLDAAIELLAAQTRRPPDSRSVDLQRHLISAVLLLVERWYEATRIEQRDADDPDLRLYRRFGDVLERDYARRHDAPHYADQLGVPQAALSRARNDDGEDDQGTDHRPPDAGGSEAAAFQRAGSRRGRLPGWLRRSAVFLACVQTAVRSVALGIPRPDARAGPRELRLPKQARARRVRGDLETVGRAGGPRVRTLRAACQDGVAGALDGGRTGRVHALS